MADLRSDFVGIKSPNPFWPASVPPKGKQLNVRRAFKAVWGGVENPAAMAGFSDAHSSGRT